MIGNFDMQERTTSTSSEYSKKSDNDEPESQSMEASTVAKQPVKEDPKSPMMDM